MIYTTAQLADLLHVSVKHVQRLYARGLITPVDVGIGRRKLRVTQAELDRYLSACVVGEKKRERRREYVGKVL